MIQFTQPFTMTAGNTNAVSYAVWPVQTVAAELPEDEIGWLRRRVREITDELG